MQDAFRQVAGVAWQPALLQQEDKLAVLLQDACAYLTDNSKFKSRHVEMEAEESDEDGNSGPDEQAEKDRSSSSQMTMLKFFTPALQGKGKELKTELVDEDSDRSEIVDSLREICSELGDAFFQASNKPIRRTDVHKFTQLLAAVESEEAKLSKIDTVDSSGNESEYESCESGDEQEMRDEMQDELRDLENHACEMHSNGHKQTIKEYMAELEVKKRDMEGTSSKRRKTEGE